MLELDFRAVKFCSSLDGIWTHTIDTLQHHSLSLTSSDLDHSTTSTHIVYMLLLIGFGGINFSQQYSFQGEQIRWEAHFEQSISTIVCLIFIKDLSKWQQWHQNNITLEINNEFSYHTCHLIINIMVCKDQREHFYVLVILFIVFFSMFLGEVIKIVFILK